MLAEAQRSALQPVLPKLDALEAHLPAVPSLPSVGNAAAVTAARRLNSAAGFAGRISAAG